MTTIVIPNNALRAVRLGMRMSQDDFARALRDAGRRVGAVNDASKRLVQRWEAGLIMSPRPLYARALEALTGLPMANLGFDLPMPNSKVSEDGHGGHDVVHDAGAATMPLSAAGTTPRNLSGVWLSRYEYHSSGRGQTLTGLHHVVLLQHGDRLTVRSLPQASLNPDSPLTMDLSVDGSIVTGTWVEHTAADGYYKGARYHGAIQLLIEPSGRRMRGKWCGFGSEMDVNTGPWELVFQDAGTNKATMERFNVPPSVD